MLSYFGIFLDQCLQQLKIALESLVFSIVESFFPHLQVLNSISHNILNLTHFGLENNCTKQLKPFLRPLFGNIDNEEIIFPSIFFFPKKNKIATYFSYFFVFMEATLHNGSEFNAWLSELEDKKNFKVDHIGCFKSLQGFLHEESAIWKSVDR